jgi:hypothetical protein
MRRSSHSDDPSSRKGKITLQPTTVISLILQTTQPSMVRSNQPQGSTTIKETIGQMLWTIQNIGKSRGIGISD